MIAVFFCRAQFVTENILKSFSQNPDQISVLICLINFLILNLVFTDVINQDRQEVFQGIDVLKADDFFCQTDFLDQREKAVVEKIVLVFKVAVKG